MGSHSNDSEYYCPLRCGVTDILGVHQSWENKVPLKLETASSSNRWLPKFQKNRFSPLWLLTWRWRNQAPPNQLSDYTLYHKPDDHVFNQHHCENFKFHPYSLTRSLPVWPIQGSFNLYRQSQCRLYSMNHQTHDSILNQEP